MKNTALCFVTKANALPTDSDLFPIVRQNTGLTYVFLSLFLFWQASRRMNRGAYLFENKAAEFRRSSLFLALK